MYKAVIVDDEKFVRQNIISIVDDVELNLEIVAQASNGRDALELIQQYNPNIVITDIKMPLINGIELIKLVKKKCPKTYFIILSGYDDFEYMKEAIKLGVEDYIRKPVQEDELKETLANIIAKLHNDERECIEEFILSKQNDNASLLLNQLVHSNIINPQIQSQFTYEQFSIFILNNVMNYTKASEKEVVDHIELKLQQLISDNNLGSIKSFIFMDTYYKDAVIIIINGAGLNNCVIKQMVLCILDYLNITSSLDYACKALSPIFNNSGKIHEFYLETLMLLKNNILIGSSPIIDSSSFKMTDKEFLLFIYKSIDNITQAINDKFFSKTTTLIKDIFSDEKKIYFSVDLLESVIMQIGTVLKRLIIVYEINLSIDIRDTLDALFFTDFILRFKNLSELKNYIIKVATNIFVVFPNIDDGNVIDKVLFYINTHYNSDLTLPNVAKEFFVNPSYLSSSFKSKIGINFSTYIENLRISNAEELIKLNITEICEVAYKVGYNDPNYFSKIFKKKTGFSPSNYIRNLK